MSNEESGNGASDGESAVQRALDDTIGRLGTTGELLIALGAVGILLVDLLGDIIFDDYSFPSIAWIAALLIVVAVVLRRFREAALPMDYTWSLIVLGFVAGAVIARELVVDLRFDVLERGAATVVFALLLYAAGALVLVGSSLVWSDTSD